MKIEILSRLPRCYSTLPHLDAIIPRIGPSVTFFGLSVTRQCEQMGVYVANDHLAIARSSDKLRATRRSRTAESM